MMRIFQGSRRGSSAGAWLLFLLVMGCNRSSVHAYKSPEGQDDAVRASELSIQYENLVICDQTSIALYEADNTMEIPPCIIYDENPTTGDDNDDENRTSILTVVGVFSSAAHVSYDGAVVLARKINQDNEGMGGKIGYNGDYYLKIRLVIGIAGNSRQLSSQEYSQNQQHLLESMLIALQPQYILGSCCDPSLDKPLAGKYQTMVLSQVGPEGFYTAEDSNEYVFGIHIPSETYGLPAYQSLKFALPFQEQRAKQKVRVVYSNRSLFLRSTCETILHRAIDEGFEMTQGLEWDPNLDADKDGILNRDDEDFFIDLADEICSKEEANENVAIWACFDSDFSTNVLLQRLKYNGCRPSIFWLTQATWDYAISRFPENVHYMQGGAQWHKSMLYSDEYFETGQHMVDHAAAEFGYSPHYGILGSYHALYMMYQNTLRYFKTQDIPDVDDAYANRYEDIRRHMWGITVSQSIYGPTSFNENRRNVGRGSAGVQWAVPPDSESGEFDMLLVSPLDQATASVIVPSPAAVECEPGSYINKSMILTQDSLLVDKCDVCPLNTFHPVRNADHQCRSCTRGFTNQTGSVDCFEYEENLVSDGLIVFGYILMSMNFALAIFFGIWTWWYRKDPVFQVSQVEFLELICIGSLLSSSAIIPLSIQAGVLDDTTAAERACTAIPWLYTTGWILQYASILAKSARMYQVMQGVTTMKRVTISAANMFKIVALTLAVNWALVLPWTIVDPFTWERIELGVTVDEDTNTVVLESIGRCDSDNLGAWAGSLLSFHFIIMIMTNGFLWTLRAVNDRYQESKYITLASLFACEFLILGIPILLAVKDSADARHAALICIVAFSDMGILLMLFLPKIYFQFKGIPEGASVAQTILKKGTPGSFRNVQSSFSRTTDNNHVQGSFSANNNLQSSWRTNNNAQSSFRSDPNASSSFKAVLEDPNSESTGRSSRASQRNLSSRIEVGLEAVNEASNEISGDQTAEQSHDLLLHNENIDPVGDHHTEEVNIEKTEVTAEQSEAGYMVSDSTLQDGAGMIEPVEDT